MCIFQICTHVKKSRNGVFSRLLFSNFTMLAKANHIIAASIWITSDENKRGLFYQAIFILRKQSVKLDHFQIFYVRTYLEKYSLFCFCFQLFKDRPRLRNDQINDDNIILFMYIHQIIFDVIPKYDMTHM